MKNSIKTKTAIVFSGLLVVASLACSKTSQVSDGEEYTMGVLDTLTLRQRLQTSATVTPSPAEIESLLYMREEEKMARDVYTSLGKKWNTRIFDNIASAEQTHMDAVLLLLNRYGLNDPAAGNGPGVFTNDTLQALYQQLVQQGNTSLVEAFRAGAYIEDRDIYDLKNALAVVKSADIQLVYGNLQKASRNHLRSFYKNVVRAGSVYTPQYLTPSEFDSIINSPMERGF